MKPYESIAFDFIASTNADIVRTSQEELPDDICNDPFEMTEIFLR